MLRSGLIWVFLVMTMGFVRTELLVGQERLITVTGTGTAELVPDVAIASFSVAGSAETVSGALADFQRNRQHIEDTLNPMDFPGVTLEFKGKSVGDSQSNQMQMMMFGDGMQEANPGASTITESFLVRFQVGESGVTDARLAELTRVIDAAIAAKARPGLPPSDFYNPGTLSAGIVTVSASGTEKAEREATRAAFARAREKAIFLASVSELELGEVHSIELVDSAAETSNQWPGNPSIPTDSSLVGSRIRITNTVTARFLVRPKTPE